MPESDKKLYFLYMRWDKVSVKMTYYYDWVLIAHIEYMFF